MGSRIGKSVVKILVRRRGLKSSRYKSTCARDNGNVPVYSVREG